MTGVVRDSLDAIRDLDPVDVDDLSSASLARVRARVNEAATRPEGRQRPRWSSGLGLAGAAAVVLVAVAAMSRLGGGVSPSPEPTQGQMIGACLETYSLETLAHRDFAFAGTVSDIQDDAVTFVVDEAWRGVTGPSVTLQVSGMTGVVLTPDGGPTLTVGQPYLVAGDDQFVWPCGFTQPFDPLVADAWAAALRP